MSGDPSYMRATTSSSQKIRKPEERRETLASTHQTPRPVYNHHRLEKYNFMRYTKASISRSVIWPRIPPKSKYSWEDAKEAILTRNSYLKLKQTRSLARALENYLFKYPAELREIIYQQMYGSAEDKVWFDETGELRFDGVYEHSFIGSKALYQDYVHSFLLYGTPLIVLHNQNPENWNGEPWQWEFVNKLSPTRERKGCDTKFGLADIAPGVISRMRRCRIVVKHDAISRRSSNGASIPTNNHVYRNLMYRLRLIFTDATRMQDLRIGIITKEYFSDPHAGPPTLQSPTSHDPMTLTSAAKLGVDFPMRGFNELVVHEPQLSPKDAYHEPGRLLGSVTSWRHTCHKRNDPAHAGERAATTQGKTCPDCKLWGPTIDLNSLEKERYYQLPLMQQRQDLKYRRGDLAAIHGLDWYHDTEKFTGVWTKKKEDETIRVLYEVSRAEDTPIWDVSPLQRILRNGGFRRHAV